MKSFIKIVLLVSVSAVFVVVALRYSDVIKAALGLAKEKSTAEEKKPVPAAPNGPPTVELLDSQLPSIKIGEVGRHAFPVEKAAIGSIDFDEDLSVAVFSNYQGKIITALAQLGDVVTKGQPLYTIDSPDLLQAESNLIGAAATLELTNKELVRAKEAYDLDKAVAQREYEQAINDQQTAEGALNAARDAVRVFGKSNQEIEAAIKSRKVDPALVVPSPVSGQITARNAQPGLLVQPGNLPAPYNVADISVKWMLANVMESDSPWFKVGQPVEVQVMAFPGRTFTGKNSKIGETIDPNTHRLMTRAEVEDPKNELLPGMLATFIIRVREPVEATALPVNGVVREGDGTMTAWVTSDRHHFTQKVVKIGIQKDDEWEILEGVKSGELAVTDGAVFLSNMLHAPPTDD